MWHVRYACIWFICMSWGCTRWTIYIYIFTESITTYEQSACFWPSPPWPSQQAENCPARALGAAVDRMISSSHPYYGNVQPAGNHWKLVPIYVDNLWHEWTKWFWKIWWNVWWKYIGQLLMVNYWLDKYWCIHVVLERMVEMGAEEKMAYRGGHTRAYRWSASWEHGHGNRTHDWGSKRNVVKTTISHPFGNGLYLYHLKTKCDLGDGYYCFTHIKVNGWCRSCADMSLLLFNKMIVAPTSSSHRLQNW